MKGYWDYFNDELYELVNQLKKSDMKRIKYKLKNDNTIYTYVGTLDSFKMTTGYSKIVSITEV